MNLRETEQKLELLRKEWKLHPEKRSKIMLQVRPLLAAIAIYKKNHQESVIDNGTL